MFNQIFRNTKRWFAESSERALDDAYLAALKIKQIEDEHFKGKKISSEYTDYGANLFAYFKNELNSNLQIIKIKMAQFKTSRLFFNISDSSSPNFNVKKDSVDSDNIGSKKSIFFEKLKFIDCLTEKYQNSSNSANKYQEYHQILLEKKPQKIVKTDSNFTKNNSYRLQRNPKLTAAKNNEKKEPHTETVSDKTSVLPRSFLRTLNRIKQEIDPKSAETEEDVVNKFRRSRYKTAISLKFLLLLIIIPLLVHNLSKIALGQLFIDPYFSSHEQIVFLNSDLQEEAFMELRNFEENLHFKSIIGLIPELSKEELEVEIKHKANELAKDYRQRSADAVKNIFADIVSLGAFALIIFYSKKEILILKSFLDEMIYGLSDSAKAFLIILFTDMFVGFHSPHGWEIILESIGRHFGLPENRDFNFLFIATFPVILDTVLKYWIFRYLNRISPSAVATYKNMNES
jgi:hypothetical protein